MNLDQYRIARPLLRSLLQKAVRRGRTDLAHNASYVLAGHGDSIWLRSRIGIIAFEECWPLAMTLYNEQNSSKALAEISTTVKNKEAAGLGSLAHALSEGKHSALTAAPDSRAVKIVAAALRRPTDFFKWTLSECKCETEMKVVLVAQKVFAQASWPWDKAFAAAGAYLSCQTDTPIPAPIELTSTGEFEFWTAIDKHTPQGRIAIKKAASELSIRVDLLEWISFYIESAKVNALETCLWWDAEAKWRLSLLGIDTIEAKEIWNFAAPKVKFLTQESAELLRQAVHDAENAPLLQVQ